MADYRVPDDRESKIIRENGMNPDMVAVMLRGESFLILLNYKTRCTIRIDRGDRVWKQ